MPQVHPSQADLFAYLTIAVHVCGESATRNRRVIVVLQYSTYKA